MRHGTGSGAEGAVATYKIGDVSCQRGKWRRRREREVSREVWRTLDDGDGVLTVEEFTNGLRRMKGEAKAKDVLDMLKRLRISGGKASELQQHANSLRGTLNACRNDVEEIRHDMTLVLTIFEELSNRIHPPEDKGHKKHSGKSPPRANLGLHVDRTKNKVPGNVFGKSATAVMQTGVMTY